MKVNGEDVIFFYVKCRKCNKTICIPAIEGTDLCHLMFHNSIDPITMNDQNHPKCKLLYPKHFTTLVDIIYYSYDDPDIALAKELKYDIDFTPYESFKQDIENNER